MKSPVPAKAALLQALCRGDGFGLELIDRVRVLTGGYIVLKQGSVYPALDALERDGMIVGADEGARPEGGRPRRYFSLTEKGRRVAAEHRETIVALLLGADRHVA